MASQGHSETTDESRDRLSITDVSEGDRVFMGINLHGSTDDVPGTEYDRTIYQSGALGTVVEGMTDVEKEMLVDDEMGRPMTDVVVETDDGHRFNWNVDNGYVIGHSNSHGGRTDVGKIGGFYTA